MQGSQILPSLFVYSLITNRPIVGFLYYASCTIAHAVDSRGSKAFSGVSM